MVALTERGGDEMVQENIETMQKDVTSVMKSEFCGIDSSLILTSHSKLAVVSNSTTIMEISESPKSQPIIKESSPFNAPFILVVEDEVFCFCRFSVSNDMNQVLYIAAATGKGGSIVTWDTKTWKRIGSKTVVRDTISAFSVSPDGKFLACGTTQGDVFILNSASKQVQTVVRKAHLGFVTALSFSHDSRALASVSLDSSARVTLIEEKREAGETTIATFSGEASESNSI
ncbi:sec12-like protein 2 [Quercus suber]|uniref:Sec12-like protein 2 n=1 Tax=Quercus suber TaxID=58331 RepID=A0AAW0LTI0_QUESU